MAQKRRTKSQAMKDVAISMDGFAEALVKSFEAQVTLTMAQAKTVFKGLGLDVFNRIRADTPWDTGFARGQWRIKAEEDKLTVTITMWNGAAYILPLEFGHSQKAPDGMLRRNFDAARDRLRSARKELLGG